MGAPKNPPAFPCETGPHKQGFQSGSQLWTHPGMSLRDYFAGQALVAMVQPVLTKFTADPKATDAQATEALARAVYYVADAMLAESEKGGDA